MYKYDGRIDVPKKLQEYMENDFIKPCYIIDIVDRLKKL